MNEQANGPTGLGKSLRKLHGKARLAAIGDVVSRWRGSGQSQAAFCQEAGIATVTLGRWLRELAAAKAPKAGAPLLVEVGVHENHSRDGYEVVLPSGSRVRVPQSFRAEDLARLLGVLAAAC